MLQCAEEHFVMPPPRLYHIIYMIITKTIKANAINSKNFALIRQKLISLVKQVSKKYAQKHVERVQNQNQGQNRFQIVRHLNRKTVNRFV